MLLTFAQRLASFQKSNDKCDERNKAIIDDLCRGGVSKRNEITANDSAQAVKRPDTFITHDSLATVITTTTTPAGRVATVTTPSLTINNDNDDDIYDSVITTHNTNQPNYYYQKVYRDGTDKTGYFTNEFFINTIKEKQKCKRNGIDNEVNTSIKYHQPQQHQHQQQTDNMGSNVSRHSAKGLSGRRTQSSGEVFQSQFCSRIIKKGGEKGKEIERARKRDREGGGEGIGRGKV